MYSNIMETHKSILEVKNGIMRPEGHLFAHRAIKGHENMHGTKKKILHHSKQDLNL